MRSHFSASVDAIALAAATAKTCLELATPSTGRVRICGWWAEFDGVTAANVPVKVEAGVFSAAVTTATTITASTTLMDPGDASPVAVLKHTTTTEGAGTFSRGEVHRVPPTSGLIVQYPLGQEWVVGVSSFWRLRLTAAQVVDATVGVWWEE